MTRVSANNGVAANTEEHMLESKLDALVDSCGDLDITLDADAVDSNNTAQFVGEACTVAKSPYIPGHLALASPGLQDVREWFKRPRLIARGTVSLATGNLFTQPVTANVIFGTLFLNQVPQLLSAYGVRFKCCFRLQCAANPMATGILIQGFEYGVGIDTSPVYQKRHTSVNTMLNCPHSFLNVATETSCVMEIPFKSVLDFYRINDLFSHGIYVVKQWLPSPSVTGNTIPTWETYFWLEDVEFIGAAPAQTNLIQPQSKGGRTNAMWERRSHVIAKMNFEPQAISTSAAVGKRVKSHPMGSVKPAIQGSNDEKTSDYPVSGFFDAVGNLAGFVNKVLPIPIVSTIATGVSWAAGVASFTARAFGFSKRPVREGPSKMQLAYPHEHLIDVPQNALIVAATSANEIMSDSSLGYSDVDELSLAFLFSQPSVVNFGAFTTATTHGANIYSSFVSPSSLWLRFAPWNLPIYTGLGKANTNNNAIQPSSLFYFSSMFEYWRGSITYRFRFAKSKMHSGRLQISFVPDNTIRQVVDYSNVATWPSVPGITSAAGFMPSSHTCQIFDLQSAETFEFTVPYLNTTPYTRWSQQTGYIYMLVIDPIQGSNAVTNSISFSVEVFSTDFEVAGFKGSVFEPAGPSAFVQQSMNIDLAPSMSCIGERFLSAKQIMMSPTTIRCYFVGDSCSPAPWYALNARNMNNIAPTSPELCNSTAIATCFTFVKGGTYFTWYPNASYGAQSFAASMTYSLDTSTQRQNGNLRQSLNNCVTAVSPPNIPYTFLFPYQAQTSRILAWSLLSDTINSIPNLSGPYNVQALGVPTVHPVLTVPSGASPFYPLRRSAADDARCAVYKGPPLINVYSVSSVAGAHIPTALV